MVLFTLRSYPNFGFVADNIVKYKEVLCKLHGLFEPDIKKGSNNKAVS